MTVAHPWANVSPSLLVTRAYPTVVIAVPFSLRSFENSNMERVLERVQRPKPGHDREWYRLLECQANAVFILRCFARIDAAGIGFSPEGQQLVCGLSVAPPLCQIADAGEGYVAIFLACLLDCPDVYLTNALLTDAELASKLIECLPPATAKENGLLSFCEFAQIRGDCWHSLISLKINCLGISKRGDVQGIGAPESQCVGSGLKELRYLALNSKLGVRARRTRPR